MNKKRTHSCGQLTLKDEGKEVVLAGWIHRRRDLGGLIFIDLRDREGITQIVFDSNENPDLHLAAEKLNREFVVSVSGKVVRRRDGTENPKIETGRIEVRAQALDVLNSCSSSFPIARLDEEGEKFLPSEDVRLKYRYLDLRRKKMFLNLKLRHRVLMAIREFLNQEGFLEIETPMLIRSTPEGARDYLVPSRIHPGSFYALPQSPQLFKQLLMVAGVEKYFQIARCMRDEDLRADRQPEFTQLDLEMSFVDREDVLSLMERLLAYLFKKVLNVELCIPFPRLSYQDSMECYGTDKPDLRFDLGMHELTGVLKGSSVKIFEEAIEKGEAIKGIHVEKGADKFSRKELDDLSDWVKRQGGKGLLSFVWTDEAPGIKSALAKNLSLNQIEALRKALKAHPGDLSFLAADRRPFLLDWFGKFRVELARKLELIQDKFAFLWIVDFPMFQWNQEENRYDPVHHPFTSPHPDDLSFLTSEPARVRANAYDIILNGFELGSGSIRIHERVLQEKIFNLIGLTQSQAQEKFGFLLEAFQYGAPPHGGIAPGIDRLVMLMAGEETIREVIAFPKNQSAQDLMIGAPVQATQKQLDELFLEVKLSQRGQVHF